MRKFLLFIILTSLFVSCTSKKQKAKDMLAKATEHFKKNAYGDAEKEVNLAIQLDSSNFDILILKAKIKSAVTLNEEAISILKKVAKGNFKTDTVNYLIGECYFQIGSNYLLQKGDTDKCKIVYEYSIKYADLCISKNIMYFDAYIGKQRALHNIGKYDEALITLNNAIAFFPDSMKLIYCRGVEKSSLGDNVGAMSDLNKAIETNKLDSADIATAYRFRGIIYHEGDSVDKAIHDLTMSLNYDPKGELAYVARGNCYKEKGFKDKACDDYRKAADLGYIKMYETINNYCKK